MNTAQPECLRAAATPVNDHLIRGHSVVLGERDEPEAGVAERLWDLSSGPPTMPTA